MPTQKCGPAADSTTARIGSEEPTDLLAPGRILLDAELVGVESMVGDEI